MSTSATTRTPLTLTPDIGTPDTPHDGDGNRVQSVLNSQTTLFVGEHYRKEGSLVTKYYFAGSQRVAMRQGGTVHYLLSDHLGSTSVVYNASTGTAVTQLYKPWGEVRYSSGALPTKYTYTGQYNNTADFGLMYYDPTLGRFAQADSIIPEASQGTQAWDRYAGMNNNPVRYSDQSGHCIDGFSTIICAAVIGAAISVVVDAYITTQVNHEEYTLEKAVIAGTIGAASGAIGAGIIAPLATTIGSGVGAAASYVLGPISSTAVTLQTSATLAVGATLSAASNVGLSATQDTLTQISDGKSVTLQTFQDSYLLPTSRGSMRNRLDFDDIL